MSGKWHAGYKAGYLKKRLPNMGAFLFSNILVFMSKHYNFLSILGPTVKTIRVTIFPRDCKVNTCDTQ